MENITEDHLIQKSQNLSLKINFDANIKQLNESNSNIIDNIINNKFYSIIIRWREWKNKFNLRIKLYYKYD